MTENVSSLSPSDHRDRREAWVAWALLAVASAAFLAFLSQYVPRLNNFVYSDREFTGWVGPIAERVGRGERLYDDLVLPIPPGSFLLLSAIQRLTGKALLLQELWVAALSHWAMGLMAYAIAVRFSSRKVGVLVALCTLVLVVQTPKECVYDHTSLLFAWLGVLVATRAVLSEGTKASRYWLSTGLLSSLSLGFKQSTATGMIAGWVAALFYLWAVEARAGRRDGAAERLRGAKAFAIGVLAGTGLVVLLVLAAGARPRGFVQAVLLDGPELKGGARTLLVNLFAFLFHYDAIKNTIVPTAFVLAIGLSVARRHGNVHVGDEPEARPSLGRASIALLLAAPVVTYGIATAMLAGQVRALQPFFTALCENLRSVPAYGFVYAAVFFAAHLHEKSAATAERRARGHALNAIVLASVTCSVIYDISFVEFRPFYYNEPCIPIALLCLFIATERSGLVWATPVALVTLMMPTFGAKLNRALSDGTLVRSGHWAGLRVNYRGTEVLDAAARARELAGPAGTVLVLPEDVELVGLIARPRPKLRGAVIFVDQYPKRLLAGDLETLDRRLPDVVVIHPRHARDWRAVFRTWATGSAAEKMTEHVLGLLPEQYTLDSSYPTIYFWDQGQIDVYARKPGAPALR
jgi:hypothetical protein